MRHSWWIAAALGMSVVSAWIAACNGDVFTAGAPTAAGDAAAQAESGALDGSSDVGSSPSCDGGHLALDEASGRCYRFVGEMYSWETAEGDCVTWGGHLASMSNVGEHGTVKRLLEREAADGSDAGSHGAWIGLNDRAQEGSWVWADGHTLTFQNWDVGEPSVGDIERNCAFQYGTYTAALNGTWDDYKCDNKQAYVCVR